MLFQKIQNNSGHVCFPVPPAGTLSMSKVPTPHQRVGINVSVLDTGGNIGVITDKVSIKVGSGQSPSWQVNVFSNQKDYLKPWGPEVVDRDLNVTV